MHCESTLIIASLPKYRLLEVVDPLLIIRSLGTARRFTLQMSMFLSALHQKFCAAIRPSRLFGY
jgi:hypothetical protein